MLGCWNKDIRHNAGILEYWDTGMKDNAGPGEISFADLRYYTEWLFYLE